MAGWYRRAGEGVKKTPYAPGTIDHCERLVKDYKATADDLTTLAKEHETMAGAPRSNPVCESRGAVRPLGRLLNLRGALEINLPRINSS